LDALPDFCKWIRLANKAQIYVINEQLTFFRVHSDSTNTSGQNLENYNLLIVEEYLVLDEFLRIASEDFLLVFPEADSFIPPLSKGAESSDCEQITSFLLAQICVHDERYSYRQFGLSLLYQLLSDSETRQAIYELYSYNDISFFHDKQQSGIYAATHANRILLCELLYRTASLPNTWQSQQKHALVRSDGTVIVRFEFADRINDVIDIRFKPEMRDFWQYQIITVLADSGFARTNAYNWPYSSAHGNLFYDDYPCYLIEGISNLSWIEISCIAKYADRIDYAEFIRQEHSMRSAAKSQAWKVFMGFRRIKNRIKGFYLRKEQ
jgi:hypothetical protein